MKYILSLIGFMIFHFSQGQDVYEVDVVVRENSFVVNNTAVDMIANGNYLTAAKILEKVIEDDPTYHAAYLNFYRAGSQVEEKKEKVIDVLREGLQIFKEDDEMAYYLGNLLQRENRLEEAIEVYSEAIAYSKINGEDFPLVWAYHFNRGNCFLKTNQFKKAILDYNYALSLSPDNADVLTNRGYCHYKSNDPGSACNDWHTAMDLGNSQTSRYIESFCQ